MQLTMAEVKNNVPHEMHKSSNPNPNKAPCGPVKNGKEEKKPEIKPTFLNPC